jgi:hypothetical protein
MGHSQILNFNHRQMVLHSLLCYKAENIHIYNQILGRQKAEQHVFEYLSKLVWCIISELQKLPYILH